MQNKKDHIAAWQFFGCGSLVAFLVMVVLWYNECGETARWMKWEKVVEKNWDGVIGDRDELAVENDSLYKANDSLKRANVQLRTSDPSIIVGGDMIKGDKIVNQ